MYALTAYLYIPESLHWLIKGCLLFLTGTIQPKLDTNVFLATDLLAPGTPNVCFTVLKDDMWGQIAQLFEIAIGNIGNRDMFGPVG